VLTLDPGVLPATFTALRRCGGGERECVVYWLGPSDHPSVVDHVLQPPHTASRVHYEIDTNWVTELFLELRATRRSVRAQVHTHPGSSVEHSHTDDSFALAPSVGFVSLVLPHFATGPATLEGSYTTVITPAGWMEMVPEEVITWS
jgi:hypothetical protein